MLRSRWSSQPKYQQAWATLRQLTPPAVNSRKHPDGGVVPDPAYSGRTHTAEPGANGSKTGAVGGLRGMAGPFLLMPRAAGVAGIDAGGSAYRLAESCIALGYGEVVGVRVQEVPQVRVDRGDVFEYCLDLESWVGGCRSFRQSACRCFARQSRGLL